MVEFSRDDFGRVIPNLYPPDLYGHGPHGTDLEPIPPPALSFPGSREMRETEDPPIVTTTSPGPDD